jgi:hypothetical protein
MVGLLVKIGTGDGAPWCSSDDHILATQIRN